VYEKILSKQKTALEISLGGFLFWAACLYMANVVNELPVEVAVLPEASALVNV